MHNKGRFKVILTVGLPYPILAETILAFGCGPTTVSRETLTVVSGQWAVDFSQTIFSFNLTIKKHPNGCFFLLSFIFKKFCYKFGAFIFHNATIYFGFMIISQRK